MLVRVAQRLGKLREDVVFVDGAAAGLLIADMAMPPIRGTDDVDVIAPMQALKEYHRLEEQLRRQGFTPDLRPESAWLPCPYDSAVMLRGALQAARCVD